MREFQQSLYDLGVGFVDLLLIHWPGPVALPEDRIPQDLGTPGRVVPEVAVVPWAP